MEKDLENTVPDAEGNNAAASKEADAEMLKDDNFSDLIELVGQTKAKLKPGGPAVDHLALQAYIDGELDEASRRAVSTRIVMWEDWNREYWELVSYTTRSDLDKDESSDAEMLKDDAFTEVIEIVKETKANLKPGGPAIDRVLLQAYIDGELDEASRRAVSTRIVMWEDWNREFWEMEADTTRSDFVDALSRKKQSS